MSGSWRILARWRTKASPSSFSRPRRAAVAKVGVAAPGRSRRPPRSYLVMASRPDQQVEGEPTGRALRGVKLSPKHAVGGRRLEQGEDRVDDVAVIVPLLLEKARYAGEVVGEVRGVIGAAARRRPPGRRHAPAGPSRSGAAAAARARSRPSAWQICGRRGARRSRRASPRRAALDKMGETVRKADGGGDPSSGRRRR